MRIESREVVADATVENLFAVAAIDRGFARAAGGDENGKTRETAKSEKGRDASPRHPIS
jgi:hypothetical protein